MEVGKRDFEQLYEDFSREKFELDSTLSTLELLSDRDALNDISNGLNEIEKGEFEVLSFDEIDDL